MMLPRADIYHIISFSYSFSGKEEKKKVRENETVTWPGLIGRGKQYSTHGSFKFGAHVHEAPPTRLWDLFETCKNQNIRRKRDVEA